MKVFYEKSFKVLLLVSLSLLKGCSQDDPPTSIYDACCGALPSIDGRGQHSVYTPNVFTPNNDGINDVFYPLISSDSLVITGFFIKTMSDTIIYFRDRIWYNNIQFEGWNGITYENQFFPEIQRTEHKGPFKYEFSIEYPDGYIAVVTGNACTIRCGPEASLFKEKKDCFYPNQVNNNVFDPEISPGEEACFE